VQYKGHLENISENTLIGAVNSENGKVRMPKNKEEQVLTVLT
jgi:hypothetical protein